MKAVVCRAFGAPDSLVVEDLPDLVAGPGQAVIDVKAAGVNFPDVLTVEGKYQLKPPLPFTPGNEFAGVVRSVGEGVAAFQPGDRVIGFRQTGAFAEQVLAPASSLLPMRPGWPSTSPHRSRSPTAPRTTRLPTAARSRRARRCWCWARPAASAWPRSKSARRWARA